MLKLTTVNSILLIPKNSIKNSIKNPQNPFSFYSLKTYSGISSDKAYWKIWHIVRNLDVEGSGRVEIGIEELLSLVNRCLPTVYEWLRELKKVGGLRDWSIKKNKLVTYYTSLAKVTKILNLEDWGAVAEVPLKDFINQPRREAIRIETQEQQQKSRFAAKAAMKNRERKYLKVQSPEKLLGATARPTSSNRQIIYRGESKLFVNQEFVPFGVSQAKLAEQLGCSERTIRRHQEGLNKRQIVQTKPDYLLINLALEFGVTSGGGAESYLSDDWKGNLKLWERNGASNASRPGGHPIKAERFFMYRGKVWLYRCNIYQLNYDLIPMRTARKRLKKLIYETATVGGKEDI